MLLLSRVPATLICSILGFTVSCARTETEVPRGISKIAEELQQEAIQQALMMDMPLVAAVIVREDGVYIEGIDAVLKPNPDGIYPAPPDRSLLPCRYPCERQDIYDELTVRLQEVRGEYPDYELMVGFVEDSICGGVDCQTAGRRVTEAASGPPAPYLAPYPAFVWIGAFSGSRSDAWFKVACSGRSAPDTELCSGYVKRQ